MGEVISFKQSYQPIWAKSNHRELLVKQYLEEATPCSIEEGPGIGVGSLDLLPGVAEDYGKERSGADWHVVGTPIYVEVTGPLKPIAINRPLWIRPDKINTARFHKDRITWCVHCSHDNRLLRAICLNKTFFGEMSRGAFTLVEPRIRGNVERYCEIHADSLVVRPISALVEAIKGELHRGKQAANF